jgi:hypothetical protein
MAELGITARTTKRNEHRHTEKTPMMSGDIVEEEHMVDA